MNFRSRAVLALAALVFSPLSPALAADYDPPVYVDETPEYTPVEVGSGWYLRGDIGYNVNKSPYDVSFNGTDSSGTRFNGGLGVGYHFTDYFRGDVNLGFLSHDTYNWSDGINAIRAESNIWSGMVNGYADLGTIAGFTPYIGAGVGFLHSSRKVDDTALGISDDDTQYAFAYSLGAGLAYKVAQNTSVDLGYQYISAPGLEYFDIPSGNMDKGLDYHQIKVGLRYDLW